MHHRETHIRIGRYLNDIIFAANDGTVTTFAVVAGVVGAHLSYVVILIIGIGNLIADGFSMATSNYLGTKSESELYKREEHNEYEEIRRIPDHEKDEVTEILEAKGYKGEKLKTMVELIASNKKYWVDFMMHEEMGLAVPDAEAPHKKALVTLCSFIGFGTIPLLPYLIPAYQHPFALAVVFTASSLFITGAMRSYFSHRNWFVSGIEMLSIGGSAASIAYFIGFGLKFLTGV